MWAWPLGKYQTSPVSKSSVSEAPSASMTVVRTVPSSTYAHSAAVAMPVEFPHGTRFYPHGNSRQSFRNRQLDHGGFFAKAFADHLSLRFLKRELECRQFLPDVSGSGTLFAKLTLAMV